MMSKASNRLLTASLSLSESRMNFFIGSKAKRLLFS
jgi:hypothetical protein